MNGKSAYAIVPRVSPLPAAQEGSGSEEPYSVDAEIELEAALDEPLPSADAAHGTLTTSDEAGTDDPVYDLTEPEPPQRRAKHPDRGAIYSLEFPTQCPQCCSTISSVRVSRLLRTQVSFTSTLPRKGYIIVCPECEGILSAELSGLI